tara:strand:- start:7 stop:1710 length:1704 start_codon:yes stop_codon:yes gene_type:complete
MIKYNISYKSPHRHFIDFVLTTSTHSKERMQFQLAAWRPGRYELADFAQNINSWQAYNDKGEKLKFKKITKDLWEVETKGEEKIIIEYSFYANTLDAGSCYLDELQLYINPVHCMFYVVDRIDEDYKVILDVPNDYLIATSLTNQKNTILADNYDSLAESPIICSNSLQHDFYHVDNVKFHLWFQGPCKPNWTKLKKDFLAFTKTQIENFSSFPVDEYHFFFQVTPYQSYHGVEHTKNTVILLGPGDEIMDEKYNNLLGVSSHELYHTWNIKSIRPIEMLPYNYSKENYFRTGYVAEGVTTYMGDLMLYKSDVIDWNKFIATRNKNLEQHLMNYGRFNLSVADSGFDNWLDGYKLGAPNRKVSIYPDGALCMMMMDLQIIYNSNGQESLNSVMKELYINFGLKKIGYSDSDFINICLRYGGEDVKKIFKNHIYGTEDYIPTLKNKLKLIGLELEESKNPNLCAQFFGFVVVKENNRFIIKKVELNSCSDKAKIAPEDEIISINGQKITGKLSDLLEDCTDKVEVTIKKKFSAMNITLQIGNFYKLLKIKESKNVSKEQLDLRKFWSK